VAYCYRQSTVVCRSCQFVTVVSSAQIAESIKIPFGLRTRVRPTNHVLDAGPDLLIGMDNFEGGEGKGVI